MGSHLGEMSHSIKDGDVKPPERTRHSLQYYCCDFSSHNDLGCHSKQLHRDQEPMYVHCPYHQAVWLSPAPYCSLCSQSVPAAVLQGSSGSKSLRRVARTERRHTYQYYTPSLCTPSSIGPIISGQDGNFLTVPGLPVVAEPARSLCHLKRYQRRHRSHSLCTTDRYHYQNSTKQSFRIKIMC